MNPFSASFGALTLEVALCNCPLNGHDDDDVDFDVEVTLILMILTT